MQYLLLFVFQTQNINKDIEDMVKSESEDMNFQNLPTSDFSQPQNLSFTKVWRTFKLSQFCFKKCYIYFSRV